MEAPWKNNFVKMGRLVIENIWTAGLSWKLTDESSIFVHSDPNSGINSFVYPEFSMAFWNQSLVSIMCLIKYKLRIIWKTKVKKSSILKLFNSRAISLKRFFLKTYVMIWKIFHFLLRLQHLKKRWADKPDIEMDPKSMMIRQQHGTPIVSCFFPVHTSLILTNYEFFPFM